MSYIRGCLFFGCLEHIGPLNPNAPEKKYYPLVYFCREDLIMHKTEWYAEYYNNRSFINAVQEDRFAYWQAIQETPSSPICIPSDLSSCLHYMQGSLGVYLIILGPMKLFSPCLESS